MSAQPQVIQGNRPSEVEFKKLSRQYKRAESETIQFCIDFAASWDKLAGQRDEKAHLSELFGWSERRCQEIAQVGREYPALRTELEGVRSAAPPKLPTSIGAMTALVGAPKDTVIKLAKGGLFEEEPTREVIRKAIKTGAIHSPRRDADREPAPRKRTPLDRIKAKVESAEKHISYAHGDIAEALALMDEHEITSVRGLQVRGLQREFEKLCAHLATANPDTYEKAIKILRGNA